jgi:hypothetical protein
MRQMRDGARFAIKPLPERRIASECVRQDFNCHQAVKARVTGFVDFAHTARAEVRENLGRAEPIAAREGHLSMVDVIITQRLSLNGGAERCAVSRSLDRGGIVTQAEDDWIRLDC